MIDHIALARRNTGNGWVVMTTDGRAWEAESVSESRPLATMLDEALALLARHPAADFTFTTRLAHEVWASPFDAQSDLHSIRRDLGRATVSILIPMGNGEWRFLHKEPAAWFDHVDGCSSDDVLSFLREWPVDPETVEKGLAGPIEVWLRRAWDGRKVLEPQPVSGSNVTEFRRLRPQHSSMGAR